MIFPKFLSPIFHIDGFPPLGQAYVEGVHAASRALVINALLMTLTTYAIPKERGQRWVPSGKHTKNYGKSPFLLGKLTINGHFQ
jgi:hypothetical protein